MRQRTSNILAASTAVAALWLGAVSGLAAEAANQNNAAARPPAQAAPAPTPPAAAPAPAAPAPVARPAPPSALPIPTPPANPPPKPPTRPPAGADPRPTPQPTPQPAPVNPPTSGDPVVTLPQSPGNAFDDRDNRHRRGRGSGVYGYPWWVFSNGWSGSTWGDPWSSGYYSNSGYYSQNAYSPVPNNANNGAGPAIPVAPDLPHKDNTPSPAGVAAQIQNAVDGSPQMLAANAEVQRAQAAFNENRQRVLEPLRQKPEYKLAVARRKQADAQVQALREANPGAAPADMAPAAAAKLSAGDEVARLETEALTADPQAATARAKLDEAVARRDALRKQMIASYQPQPAK